jgi:spermidine/putrescine transport system substrate-binding protein
VAAYVNYICPVQGAKEELAKADPELAENPWIFPDEETLAKAKGFRTLTPDEDTQFSEAFQKVIGN